MRAFAHTTAVAIIGAAALAGCMPDNPATPSGPAYEGDVGQPKVGFGQFHLIEMDGRPAPKGVTLTLSPDGQVNGQGPCNRYMAKDSGTRPAIQIGPVGTTRMACSSPAVAKAEARYLDLLQSAQTADVKGGMLELRGPKGRLVYRAL